MPSSLGGLFCLCWPISTFVSQVKLFWSLSCCGFVKVIPPWNWNPPSPRRRKQERLAALLSRAEGSSFWLCWKGISAPLHACSVYSWISWKDGFLMQMLAVFIMKWQHRNRAALRGEGFNGASVAKWQWENTVVLTLIGPIQNSPYMESCRNSVILGKYVT